MKGNPPSRRLKPSLLKKHWRREGKNEVIGRKPTVAKRKDSVTVTSGDRDHNIEERGAKSSSIVTGYVLLGFYRSDLGFFSGLTTLGNSDRVMTTVRGHP